MMRAKKRTKSGGQAESAVQCTEIVLRMPEQEYGNSASDVIEGSFRVAEVTRGLHSGFYCRRCEYPTLVGERNCASCGWAFLTPTVSEVNIRADYLWGMTQDRKQLFEVKIAQKRRRDAR